MKMVPGAVKRHPWRTLVIALYVGLSPIWGPAAEAAFHLEYVTPPTKGLNFLPAIEGLRTQPPPRYEPLRATGTRSGPSVRIVEPQGSVWDRLAACESGGNWASTRGRYDGGLQFHPSTWRAAGGTRYAPTADQASREEQIAVAESWLAKTSWAQWPACSRKLGLR